ncbi:HCaRG protein [Nesidiocoris tenuis]|uniref:HCaRG protein n=1 Tax=Nesidiocoris tenuis TaxID=355587 RepID=A0ABN7AVE3_9HEMI|nr:HCaRG protein [Nesidiocoris tenuis]
MQRKKRLMIQDFCRLAWDYIAKGVNPKLYGSASEKLGISPQDLQHIVEGLVSLMIESCKLKLSSEKFVENLKSLEFNEGHIEVLNNFYTAKQVDINHSLLAASIRLPMYKDLEWRAQVQLGSRAFPDQMTPKVLLNLKLENTEKENLILQTDPGNLLHITKVLENALEEATSQHASRVHRRFNPS